jgi:ferredoxin
MRVKVNDDVCQGHTLCRMTAPDVFKLRPDDGHAYVDDEEVAPEHESDVRMAASTCPELAIELDEEPA